MAVVKSAVWVEMGMAVVECELGWRWVWRRLSARWGGDGYGGG